KPEEIMAGLCNVLPKNIWLYVSQIPNLSAIGRRFLLQGGTQYNLAAVKAQVDFIESRFKGKDVKADVIVHEHCGEAGAIGAPLVADAPPKYQFTAAQKKRAELIKKRSEIRIGMPRVLNMYSQTPIFTGYFASLGIKPENLIFSDYTSEELYKEGAKRGAIDPCFPSKLGIPHVHNLLYKLHAKKPLDIIFFPMIDCLTTDLHHVQARRTS